MSLADLRSSWVQSVEGGYPSELDQQALLAGLTKTEIAELRALAIERCFHTRERIIAAGEPATSIFFLLRGMVSVKLPSGVRFASLAHGMVYGEMALLEQVRSADVWGNTAVTLPGTPARAVQRVLRAPQPQRATDHRKSGCPFVQAIDPVQHQG